MSGETPCKKRKSTGLASSSSVVDSTDSGEVENNEDYFWLSFNQEPWSDVIQKWKNCFNMRNTISYSDVQNFYEKLKSKELVCIYFIIEIIIFLGVQGTIPLFSDNIQF